MDTPEIKPDMPVPNEPLINIEEEMRSSYIEMAITLRAYDQYGNALTYGGLVVGFVLSGGTSTGKLTPPVDDGDGVLPPLGMTAEQDLQGQGRDFNTSHPVHGRTPRNAILASPACP